MSEEDESLSLVKGLISDYLTVLDARVLRKSDRWITAVVGVESQHGKRSLRFYRWKNEGGKWKKQSSFNINREEDWEGIKKIGDEFAEEMWKNEDP